MNFNSWQFLVFFPVIWALYLFFTHKRRNGLTRLLLLASSLFFYACWNAAYLALILFSVLVTWLSGILMERAPDQKRLILAGSLALNLAVLFFFKYYNFFAGTVNSLAAGMTGVTGGPFPAFNVLLPVGISFYTFQALGYSIDVYRGTVRAERNIITYALFVTFFPQLVAGPIERTGNLLPQFKTDHHFDYDRVTSGLKLAAWGMFKKVVIADQAAIYVNAVYGNPGGYSAASLLLATFFFAIQIYCDFSGYSDIAIGSARVLGFSLMKNFRQPYFSTSITEFWRRWHISLSTWLRDYIYIPLGGNRKGVLRQNVNILITFAISGLWHGAAWHFVFWGLLHGVFQIVERSVGTLRHKQNAISGDSPAEMPVTRGKTRRVLQAAFTFVVVCLAWVFFRANSLSDAFLILEKFTTLPAELAGYVKEIPVVGAVNTVRNVLQLEDIAEAQNTVYGIRAFGLSIISTVVLIAADFWTRNISGTIRVARVPWVLRWAGYCVLVLTLVLSVKTGSSEFIYFTF